VDEFTAGRVVWDRRRVASRVSVVVVGGLDEADRLRARSLHLDLTPLTLQQLVVQAATQAIKSRFGAEIRPIAAASPAERGQAIEGAHIVLATGAAGITLLDAAQWQSSPTLELVADANASPPAGIEGVSMGDRGTESHGKILFGPLGFGALKLALHRACIGRLFEQNDLVLDAEQIYAQAKSMVG